MRNSELIYNLIIISISIFLLACQGENTEQENTPTITPSIKIKQAEPTIPKLSGIVDSSLIDRNAENKVVVYSGNFDPSSKHHKTIKPITIAARKVLADGEVTSWSIP